VGKQATSYCYMLAVHTATDTNHSVARQCYTVVRATQQVNGKWQFWGCQNSVTPEPIDQKFDTLLRRWVDLVCRVS